MKNYSFPEGFWWGAATSAPQTEGRLLGDGKGDSIWDYSSKHYNEKFFQGVTSEKTSGFYKHWKEDIQRMQDISLNSLRTSISWSRLIPDGDGEVNQEAVNFYNNVIDEMIAKGVKPFINLYHFDMPMAMQEIGGFEERKVIDAYVRYAGICFDLFGDRVEYWFTFNEPMIPAEAGYLHARHYPYVADFNRAAQVLHNIILCHAKAVAVFRQKNLPSKIGIILDVIPVYAKSESAADLKAAYYADLFFTRSINEAVILGEYPKDLANILNEESIVLEIGKEDLKIIKDNKIDLLGVNYYRPRRVQSKVTEKMSTFTPENYFDTYLPENARMNTSRGIEIFPQAIYDIAKLVQEKFGNIPWFVSENGMGIENEEQYIVNGIVEDWYRIDFLKEHLQWIHKAISEGSNCLGYHMWTFIDNWSWVNAYKNRYGFYRIDLETEARIIKQSGLWFKEVIKNNGFKSDIKIEQ